MSEWDLVSNKFWHIGIIWSYILLRNQLLAKKKKEGWHRILYGIQTLTNIYFCVQTKKNYIYFWVRRKLCFWIVLEGEDEHEQKEVWDVTWVCVRRELENSGTSNSSDIQS
jgi:hypothetical protein